MPLGLTHITYDNIDTYLFERIPGFLDFFYQVYDDSDREIKYEVFGSLTDFFKLFYKKNDKLMLSLIIDELYKLYKLEDPKIQELILTGFIENLLEENEANMIFFREVLKYKEFQECLNELYNFWYKRNL